VTPKSSFWTVSHQLPTSVFATNIHLLDKLIDDNTDLKFIALKHPGNGQKAYFHIKNDLVYETIEFGEKNRSFFINDFISSNGKIYILSRIDPIFLVGQYFIKQAKPTPVDDILYDAKFPDLIKLAAMMDVKQFAQVKILENSP
jgi:Ydr279p protein triple barrel domain